MNVADLVGAMEDIAPTRFAAAWDNVGLLVGDPERDVARVLLTIDCTKGVFEEARRERCEAIVSYHPPLFEAQKRFTAGSIGYEAARADIAIFSPHTALDVADGGTNDVLADALEMKDRTPLRMTEARDGQLKLVTFVPPNQLDAVSRALFAAGAGEIGKYTSCSFRVGGTGTFFGEEGAHPVVGSAGRLEETAEVRLEMVLPIARAPLVVRALRAAHPYEEPAFDLVRLAAAPEGHGFGRVGAVARVAVRTLVDRLKCALGVKSLLFAGDLDREVTRVAVCAGSGGELVRDAIETAAELFVTGEMRHHDALRARGAMLDVLCTLHSVSERAVLNALARRLEERLPGIAIVRSAADRDPFELV